MSAPEPISFALSEDEARIAAARAALRLSLSRGLLASHVGPLAAFVLFLAFVAILGFTDLMSRRTTEILILLAILAFMIQRLAMRRAMWRARKAAIAWCERLRSAGEVTVRFDADDACLDAVGLERRWRFADVLEAEDAGGMIYLWPRDGEPLFWPTRACGDATPWLAFARSRGASVRRVMVVEDDD